MTLPRQSLANAAVPAPVPGDEAVTDHDTLDLALAATGLGVWDWQVVTDRLRWSDRMCEIFGVPPGQPRTEADFAARIHPDDRARLAAVRERILHPDHAGDYDVDYRIVRPDGEVRDVSARGRVLWEGEGARRRPVRMVGTVLDVTVQRGEQARREESERELRLAVDAARLAISDWRLEDGRHAMRGHWEALTGFTPGEMAELAADWHAMVHPDDLPELRRQVARCLHGESTRYEADHRLRRRDGTWGWVHTRGEVVERSPDGRVSRLLSTHRDIGRRRRLLEELRQYDTLTQAMGSTEGVLLYLKDRDGRFAWVSDSVCRQVGQSREALLGLRFHDLAGPGHEADRIEAHDRQVVHEAVTLQVEEVFRDGIFLSVKTPWRDAVGQVVGLACISFDVTAQRRTERALADSEERLRMAVESSSLGWWDLDPATRTVRWSPGARRVFGFESGHDVVPLEAPVSRIHDDDRPRVQAAIDAALAPASDGSFRARFRVCLPDGELRWIDAFGSAAFYGEADARRAQRFAGVIWDVTEQQRLIESLQQADRRKDEYLAMLAHELRNPLAPVFNAVRILRATESLTETGGKALDMIDRQSVHMRRLVDDLLDVSRLTRGKIRLQPRTLDLAEAVQQAIDAIAPAVTARRHRLRLQVPPPGLVRVVADPVRVAQILENLLNNAVKYTPEGGHIRVSVSTCEGMARVSVRDDGLGIPAARLDDIFELFTQVEPSGGKGGGLGIGLALSRALARLHGGAIEVASEGPGQGSCFELKLPRVSAGG